MIGMPFEARDNVRMALIGCGGRGSGMLKEYLGVEGLHGHRRLRRGQRRRPEGAGHGGARRTEAARRVRQAASTISRNLLKRDDVDFAYIATPWDWHVPMAVAAMNERQARVRRSAGRHHHRRLLEAGGYLGEDAPPLPDAGELLLRLHRADGAEHDPRRPVRRSALRRRRLPARPAPPAVRGPERRLVAPLPAHQTERQSVSHARAGTGGQLHGHQPRRPLRLPGVDELAASAAWTPGAKRMCRKTAPSGRRSISAAT